MIKQLFSAFLFLSLLSCNKENKEINNELSEIIGKKIELIDSLSYYSQKKGFFKKQQDNSIKIVTYIDGGCGSCLYNLEKWKELMKAPELKNVCFLFYIKVYEKKQVSELISEIDFTYPIIADLSNQFYEVNRLKSDKNYQTFLVDKENKIVLVGNPLYSRKIMKLYFETISKINK
ncbi:hypothetical protein ACYE2N_00780 [Flavobacterium sp. MAHUQ-51]|uniref:hypothetical protein n=1 Tax=Flavobacterium sp. GCM10022190 TaxID=3252639 RepID=UPI0036070866